MPGERTEQATQHRRQKARREGDILHSRELTAAAGTLAGVLTLGMAATEAIEAWRGGLRGFLALGQPERWEPNQLEPTLMAIRGLSLAILAPLGTVMAAVVVASLAVGIAQTGGIALSGSAIGFKLERINPVSNAQNLFSLRAVARLVQAAHEFEGQLMKELLKPLEAGDALTGDDSGEESGSTGALGEFATETLGQALSERGGLGIADDLVRTLSQNSTKPHGKKVMPNGYQNTGLSSSQ